MTRASGFDLYACPHCRQLHKKPRYASVSVYVPKDLVIAPDQKITCHYCLAVSKFSEYVHDSYVPPPEVDISWLYGKKKTILQKLFPKKKVSCTSNLYPEILGKVNE